MAVSSGSGSIDGRHLPSSESVSMYIEHLSVTGLKLLHDVTIDFRNRDGSLRGWTVLIGRNGTGKTSVLQAIALAAVGSRQVNNLAEPVLDQLRDRRPGATGAVNIFTRFSFPERALHQDLFPGLSAPIPASLRVDSNVDLWPGGSLLSATSKYTDLPTPSSHQDPLDAARDKQHKLWFVAGYGPSRHLPQSESQPQLKFPYLDRLKPLFDPVAPITSTAFANFFGRPEEGGGPRNTKANLYSRVLQKALFGNKLLLPELRGVELRGRAGVKSTGSLQESARFVQHTTAGDFKVPATALPHGHQSMIAWIADLVGHILLEAKAEVEPKDMCGLVLIDELDLYLHPTWQVVLVRALKQIFPNVQFIATTHSPLVLASLDPAEDQVIRLVQNAETGNVEAKVQSEDPRLLTASELLQLYFELDDLHPDPVGRMVHDYRYLASNPFRRDEDDARLAEWRKALAEAGVDPHYEPVPRREFRRGAP